MVETIVWKNKKSPSFFHGCLGVYHFSHDSIPTGGRHHCNKYINTYAVREQLLASFSQIFIMLTTK